MNERRPSETEEVPKIEEITEEDTSKTTSKALIVHESHDDGTAEQEPFFETDEDLMAHPPPPPTKDTEPADEFSEVETLKSTHRSRTIAITLRADSEFFNLLTKELSSIDKIEAAQKALLTAKVQNLGSKVVSVTRPSKPTSQSDLYAWREIFSLYRDAAVFFANTERHRGPRTAVQARERIQWFSEQLARNPVTRKFKNKESGLLLGEFMDINTTLLRTLLFQEMNSTATQKILKKFDKRTSLTYGLCAVEVDGSARSTFPEFMSSDPFFAESLARGVCYVMSENLLSVLPQLDDYTCPICASITFKPGILLDFRN